MLGTLLAAIAVLGPAPAPKVIGASLFKNGYAVVMREIPVAGSGDISVTELPQVTLGTLWISASDGIQIGSVVKTSEETLDSRDAAGLDDLLTANIGKTVKLGIEGDDKVLDRMVSGRIVVVTAQIVLVQSQHGTVAFAKNRIAKFVLPAERHSSSTFDSSAETDMPCP